MEGPEDQTRKTIDQMLMDSGWVIQNYKELDLSAGHGVAIREYPFSKETSDYALFINKIPVGVVEAKPEGWTLSGVTNQSDKYIKALHQKFPKHSLKPTFSYESTGVETLFVNRNDPKHRSRNVFTFHRPETLNGWFNEDTTLRSNLKRLPKLDEARLYKCQIDAVNNLEQSFADNRPRALIQMATGTGKTFTAVTFAYRLIKFAKAKRILFLVDRANLGFQAQKAFQDYTTPDDGRKFTDLYNIQHLQSQTIGDVSVVISTIQRLYSILQGNKEFDEVNDDFSNFENTVDDKQMNIKYNPNIPIGTFDFIIIDECHRSIYNKWKQVLDYFDAFLIGLTATPSKHTIGFFKNNQVMEYPHERAVADGINVGYNVYTIQTRITSDGETINAGETIEKRDKMTRKQRAETLDDPYTYEGKQLNRDVVAPDQIRTIIKEFKKKLPEIFPDRGNMLPKTVIFTKDDAHAEDVTRIVREEFGEGNEFCKKITYKTTGEKPEDIIKSFRNSVNPRIAVTVDMIATGTDIKPLECIIFMRDVHSDIYFDQMKGRGTRIIDSHSLRAVTPGAITKDHFVIVDTVGVCEHGKTDTHSLNRKQGVSFKNLLQAVAERRVDEDSLKTLAYRMSILDNKLDNDEKQEIEQVSGISMSKMIHKILDGVDTDKQIERAKRKYRTDDPTKDQIVDAMKESVDESCSLFDSVKLRKIILDVKKQNEIIIDNISKDNVIISEFNKDAKKLSMKTIENFKKFIDENKNELAALNIIYSKPYNMRNMTYKDIKDLAIAMKKPPYGLTSELIWNSYQRLEKSRVRNNPTKMLTDIISIIRFSTNYDDILMPFKETVDERFSDWLKMQESSGQIYSPEQKYWLVMIKDHIASSFSITLDDLDYAPFNQKGGRVKLYQIFGDKYEEVLEKLQEVLVSQ